MTHAMKRFLVLERLVKASAVSGAIYGASCWPATVDRTLRVEVERGSFRFCSLLDVTWEITHAIRSGLRGRRWELAPLTIRSGKGMDR